jgi:hypothetical protein
MRAVALWCSRPVHGPCGEGEKGVDEPRCRAQLWNEGERRRAAAAFDLEKKGKGEGSGTGGATRRNEERGGAVAPPGGGQRGGGGPGSRWGADGGTCGQPAVVGAGRCHGTRKQGNRAARVGRSGEGNSWAGPERTVPTWI